MRTLVVLRGPSGTGRTTFVRRLHLDPWHFDQVALEHALVSPTMTVNGTLGLDRHLRFRSRERIKQLLSEKFAAGHFVVFEPADTGAPFSISGISACDHMILSVIELAKAHFYRILIVDFSEITPEPDRIIDPLRAETFRMKPTTGCPEAAGYYRRNKKLYSAYHHLPPGVNFSDLAHCIEPETVDLSRFSNLIFIGDLHGHYRTFRKLVDDSGPRPDSAYVFLGDYVNKGPESGALISELLRQYLPRDGVVLLTGNHDRLMEDWYANGSSPKDIFETQSLPSLHSAGLDREDIGVFLARTHDAGIFHWRGLDILATHGGFSRRPNWLFPLSAEAFQNGVGPSDYDVDQAWENGIAVGENPPAGKMIQVHGHRNTKLRPIRAATGCLNLETGTRKFSALRAAILTEAGRETEIHTLSIPNID